MDSAALILFSHWNDIRGNRIAPRRAALGSARIHAIESQTFILEHSGAELRARPAGAKLIQWFGAGRPGGNILARWRDEDRAVIVRALECVSRGAVLFASMTAYAADGRSAAFEVLVAPLANEGGSPGSYLGSREALSASGWLGTVELVSFRLEGHAFVWPEIREHLHFAARDKKEAVENKILPWPRRRFSPPDPRDQPQGERGPEIINVRRARIVRAGGRQFRVYEGGLARKPRRGSDKLLAIS